MKKVQSLSKLIKASIMTAVIATVNPLYAGAGHDHGHSHSQKVMTKASAQKKAIKAMTKLVEDNKVEKSWLNAPILNIEKKKFHDNLEWVISFKNDKVKDASKQTIYIFVSQNGYITGANFTGE